MPVIALNKVDLPQLGLPITAITGLLFENDTGSPVSQHCFVIVLE
jgi:hypothetical protein